MPLVAHSKLPVFKRLATEGVRVLQPGIACQQDIRELHIGLLNMMPDAALQATERQFFRLIGESNPIAQFFVHPFTLDTIPRSDQAQAYIAQYYEGFAELREQGLDALIITGANVTHPHLPAEPFWHALIEVADWAYDHVTSTLCSCLATHAVLEFRYGTKRERQVQKKWGVFEHQVVNPRHPLVSDINTRFSVPHSRWNSIYTRQFEEAGLKILVAADDDCVHLATSPDGFRTVFFQGHPEYDTVSLLKEYKREVRLYADDKSAIYPPLPDNYLGEFESAVLREYQYKIAQSRLRGDAIPEFPESLISKQINNTWHDTACSVVGNWMGLIYRITHLDRKIPFMEIVDANNPLKI